MVVCFYHATYAFRVNLHFEVAWMASLAKPLSVRLRTKWLQVEVTFQSLNLQIDSFEIFHQFSFQIKIEYQFDLLLAPLSKGIYFLNNLHLNDLSKRF